MGIMDIILIGLGIVVIIGFLRQFGILTGKGLTYALVGAGLLFGYSLFQKLRLNRLDEDFKKREKELEDQEEKLKDIQKVLDLSNKEVEEAEAAMKREKAAFKKKMAEIEAEKEKNLKKRREEINNMSIDELMEQY